MNKKGDITVTILVIGIFLLGCFALLSFFVSSFKIGNSYSTIKVVNLANAKIDEYHFYKNLEISNEEIYTFFQIVEEDQIKYLVSEEKDAGIFGKNDKQILISIKYAIE